MRKIVILAATLGVAATLSACATGRSRPDEFAVARQRPLVVPPDYALVPPAPGTALVQGQNLQSQTLEALEATERIGWLYTYEWPSRSCRRETCGLSTCVIKSLK